MQINDKRGIDIVIPVYNALTDLQKCIESIKRHTDFTMHRVIMINDCSPDENILPYLKSIEGDGFILLDNEENMGFSATINKGMRYSDRDVILLNTDTIVTKGWVEKMIACAYSDESIGTVTPFSNNATLCSIPNFCQENVLPDGYTIDSYAALIERCSLKKYPRITVAVGFCMYIKRSVVNDIGYFDAETFGKGYGEENDFCNRAEQVGYKHVLCDDTYIYHSGTASFVSKDKLELMQAHEKILDRRYPKQMRENHLYCMQNPDQYLRDNVAIYSKLGNKKNILYVLHMDFETTVGGTQQHVKDLVEGLRKEHNIFVVSPCTQSLKVSIYLEQEIINLKYYVEDLKFISFHNESHRRVFENIYKAFQIDLVHVHHLKGFTFDPVYEAQKLDIPVVYTAHDYYAVCPNVFLVNNENHYCLPSKNDEACSACLKKSLGYAETAAGAFLEKWNREMNQIFAYCSKVVTPSNSTKEILESVYPVLKEKVAVISHGIDADSIQLDTTKLLESEQFKCNLEELPGAVGSNRFFGWAYLEGVDSYETDICILLKDKEQKEQLILCEKFERGDLAEINAKYLFAGFKAQNIDITLSGILEVRVLLRHKNKTYIKQVGTMRCEKASAETDKSLRIAFVGGLSRIKGADEIYKVIKQFKNKDIRWYIFGEVGHSDLYAYEQQNLIKIGRYNRDCILDLLRQYEIDLVCVLSVCPETYCYTLSEAIMAKIPVAVTNIGALGERIADEQAGWLIDVSNIQEELSALVKKISTDRTLLTEKQLQMASVQLKTAAEMLEEYKMLYSSFERLLHDSEYDTLMTYQAYQNAVENGSLLGADEFTINHIKQMERELNAIKESTSYKVVSAIARMNIPGKKQIKRIMLFVYQKIVKRYLF